MWSFFIRDPSKEFNYEILEQIPGTDDYMLWKLHKAKRKVCYLLFSPKRKLMFYFNEP